MTAKSTCKTNLTAFTVNQAIEKYPKTDILTIFGLSARTVNKYLKHDDKHEYNLSSDLRKDITDFINNPENNLHNIYENLLFHIAKGRYDRYKDKNRKRQSKYYYNNRGEILERTKEYYYNNRSKMLERVKSYMENRDKNRERQREKYNNRNEILEREMENRDKNRERVRKHRNKMGGDEKEHNTKNKKAHQEEWCTGNGESIKSRNDESIHKPIVSNSHTTQKNTESHNNPFENSIEPIPKPKIENNPFEKYTESIISRIATTNGQLADYLRGIPNDKADYLSGMSNDKYSFTTEPMRISLGILMHKIRGSIEVIDEVAEILAHRGIYYDSGNGEEILYCVDNMIGVINDAESQFGILDSDILKNIINEAARRVKNKK